MNQWKITALAAAISMALPVAAQQAEKNKLDYEEITVTGTKRNLSLQDTQTSVALITDKEIEEQVLVNVEDILLRTANVSTDASGAFNNLSIRGVTLDGVGFTGTGATINVYVDGSPNSFNANQGASNLWDVAQVEILRGPQSTVQGRNALAGAIVITTADPEYTFASDLRVLAGNEDNRQYSAMVTGPIIDDTLAYRIAIDQREVDFGVTNLTTGNNTRFRDELTARAKLLWEPSDNLRIDLAVSYTDTEFGEFNQVVAPGPAPTDAFNNFDPFGDETFGPRERFEFNTVTRYALDTEYRLNDNWTLYAIATFEDSQRDTNFGTSFGTGDAPDETYTGELRFTFNYDQLNGWIGAYYFDSSGSFGGNFRFSPATFGIPTIPADGFVNFITNQFDETKNKALFADVTYAFNEQWSLSVGARFDDEKFSDTGTAGEATPGPGGCTIAPFVPNLGGFPCTVLFPPTSETVPSAEFDAFLPSASLVRNFGDNHSVSLNIGRGYRAGGSYLYAPPGVVPETRTFDPEYLTNYEIAFRNRWPEQDINFNTNIFFSDWEDQQVVIQGPSGAFFDSDTLNVGSSELYGVEMEFRQNLSDSLDWFATLGYVKTEFTNFPYAVNSDGTARNPRDSRFVNLKGNEFNNSPNLSVAVGFSYDQGQGFFTSGNVSYSDDKYSDVTNLEENRVSGYTIVNLRAGYAFESWRVSLFANNLFDKRFIGRMGAYNATAGTGTVEPSTSPFFAVNNPRVFGIELRYTYE